MRKLLPPEKCRPNSKKSLLFIHPVAIQLELKGSHLALMMRFVIYFKNEKVQTNCSFFMKSFTSLQTHCLLKYIAKQTITQLYHSGVNVRKMGSGFGGPEQRVAESSSRYWGKDHKGGLFALGLKTLAKHIRSRLPCIRRICY